MKLIVLTKQFGNYTGATISTLEILKRIAKNFEQVEVITLRSQNVNIPNVKVSVASGYVDLYKKLKRQKNVVGYSDDHLGFLMALANIKYIHTYHGNWPDAKYIDFSMFLKSCVFIPLYKLTVKKATKVVSVSKYMEEKFVRKNNSNSLVIYNGIKQNNNININSTNAQSNVQRYLMVGNVDNRKYGKAIKVFDFLSQMNFDKEIDIYGKIIDKNVYRRLNKYKFTDIKGVVSNIDYSNYKALICTSASENLPVSILESILSLTPVITFDVGGINEVIINGENGFLLGKNEYSEFAKTIMSGCVNDLIFDNKKLSRIFNWDYAAKNYLNLFRSI